MNSCNLFHYFRNVNPAFVLYYILFIIYSYNEKYQKYHQAKRSNIFHKIYVLNIKEFPFQSKVAACLFSFFLNHLPIHFFCFLLYDVFFLLNKNYYLIFFAINKMCVQKDENKNIKLNGLLLCYNNSFVASYLFTPGWNSVLKLNH
jgi:hypothetical protein